jgi:pilus assembly protein CpaF
VRDLVRAALRMRPDRIVVGEVRGAEALDMLQALNTGHDGSMCTVHANGTSDALRRIETLTLFADVGLPPVAVRAHIAAAIDAVVFVARREDGRRCIEQIAELGDGSGRRFEVSPLFVADGDDLVPVAPPHRPARRRGHDLHAAWEHAPR